MIFVRRLLLALPFVIAAGLTLLIKLVDRLHLSREHTAGYVFLFAAPWAWLIDHDWFGTIQTRRLDQVVFYAMLLWVPALLYSACLWALLYGIKLTQQRFGLHSRG